MSTVCAVVHCSAGIGRTGTVLFVLLCYDNIQYYRKVDPFGILTDMRNDRAKLVENKKQFDLCLKLLDEVLFGLNNVISASDLTVENMPDLIGCCEGWFSKLQALPDPDQDYSASMQNMELNRSPDVLQPASNAVFISVSCVGFRYNTIT